jgi:hypothetical protein
MNTKKYILAVAVVLISLTSVAQESLTKDYISTTSFRGGGITFDKMVNPNFSLGFTTGWTTFYQENPKQSYEYETEGGAAGIAVTAYQYKYFNDIPIVFTAKYFIKAYDSNVFIPYLGASAGLHYIESRTDMGMVSFTSDGWPFALAPQAGVMIKTSPYTAFHVGAIWNNTFASSNVNAQSWVGLNIGLTFGH